jgi:hypothetical protein
MSDYNKLFFSNKKKADKKKADKKKAQNKAKAKAISTVVPSEETLNSHIIVPQNISNEKTGYRQIIQPNYKIQYTKSIHELKKNLKMKPRVTSIDIYNNNNDKPYNPPGYMGSPEWKKYNEKYFAPPIKYFDSYIKLVQENQYRKEMIELQRVQEKIPTEIQINTPKVLIVACEYHGTDFPLNGCFNDAKKFRALIDRIHPNADVTYLTDDQSVHNYNPFLKKNADGEWPEARWPSYNIKTFPSRKVVLKYLNELCKAPNPLLFLFLAGHGGSADDIPAPLESTMIDIDSNGVVKNSTTAADAVNPKRKSTFYFCNNYGDMNENVYDTDIYSALSHVTSNQRMYVFTDCCHSGTILNLPYIHVGNFQYKYDPSGNIITETAVEQDDFGHDVYDKDGNEVLIQRKTYNMLTPIPNNVNNKVITEADIISLMADATSDVTRFDKETGQNVTNKKFTILSGKYPSLANLKGDIIHFAGTRDNKFSFESIIKDESGNIIDRDGAFTWDWHRLWSEPLGLQKFTVQKAYTCLVGLVNNPEQIPVCSTSKMGLFNDTQLLLDFAPPPSNTPANARIVKSTNKNKNITNKSDNNTIINKKPNNTIVNKNLKKINKLVKKKTDLTKKFDSATVKAIVNAQNIFPAKKKANKKKAPKK